MNERNMAEQVLGDALSEYELSLVVGGSSDPDDLVGHGTGETVERGKATPILF